MFVGVLGESVASEESVPGGLLPSVAPGVSPFVPSVGALSVGASEVPEAFGTVVEPGSVGEGGTGDGGAGTVGFTGVLVVCPALGVTEGTPLGAPSLPLGVWALDEQPARPRPATDNNNTDGRYGFIRVPAQARLGLS